MKMIDVCYPHCVIKGGIENFVKMASKLGYSYYCWNGWVFDSKTNIRQPWVIENRILSKMEIPKGWDEDLK